MRTPMTLNLRHLLGVVGGFLLVMLVSFYYQQGGFLDVESQAFLLNYTAERGVLERVFDVARNDWNCYQAREFSYFVDLVDAKFIELCAAVGAIHFLSFSHYLLLLGVCFLHCFFMRRYFPQVPFTISVGLLMVYLTTPSSMIASFFRSSKILVGFFFFIILWLSVFETKGIAWVAGQKRRSSLILGSIFVLALVMTLSDRQGFFFACALSIVFGFAALLFREFRWFALFGIMLATSTANTVYNLYLGPALIHAFNGYYPDFSFQNLKFLYSVEGLSLYTILGRVVKSFLLLADTVSFYFGSLGAWWGLGLLVGFVYVCFQLGSVSRARYSRGSIALMSLSLLYVMALILVFRAPYLLWIEHKLVYYWIPTNSLILFVSSWLAAEWFRRRRANTAVALYVLGACVFLNLVQLPGHYDAYTSSESHFALPSQSAKELSDCVSEKDLPTEAFALTSREKSVCVKLRDA